MPRELFRKFDSPNLRGALGGALFLLLFSVAISVHWRPGTTGHHDSAYYLDGARHLARGEGFVSAESGVNGQKLAIANWPPGFSLMIVPGLWLGLSVHESAAVVLGGSYVLLLLSIYALLLLCTRLDRWPWALASCVVFALTASLLDMLNRLLSDLPMSAALVLTLALSVALLRGLPHFSEKKSAYGISVIGAGLLGAVTLIRWAGMFAVFGVMTALAVSIPWAALRRLWKQVCVFVAVLAAIVGGWMLRNWALTGETMGQRHLQTTDPSPHLERAVSGVFLWATDARVLFGAESFWWNLYQALLGGLFLLLVLGFRRATFDFPLGVRLISITAAAYFFGLVFSASNHTFNSLLHPRYWIFVWAALLCLAFSACAATTGRLKWAAQGVFSLSLLVSFIVGLSHYYARRDVKEALPNRQQRQSSALGKPRIQPALPISLLKGPVAKALHTGRHLRCVGPARGSFTAQGSQEATPAALLRREDELGPSRSPAQDLRNLAPRTSVRRLKFKARGLG
jgi:hypothetical protein